MRKKFLVILKLTVGLMVSAFPCAAANVPDVTDTAAYSSWLEDKISENISAGDSAVYTERLVSLAPALGDAAVSGRLKAALLKRGAGSDIEARLLGLAIDDLDGGSSFCQGKFTVIRGWNISGPWRAYGRPDMIVKFQPERASGIAAIERGRNIVSASDGEVSPFSFEGDSFETVYATASFTSAGGAVLWVISDGQYQLIINGREVYRNPQPAKKNVEAFMLRGGKGYTVQLKIQRGEKTNNPFFRAMVSGEGNTAPVIKFSGDVFSYNFTADRLTAADKAEEMNSGSGSDSVRKIRALVKSGNYTAAYRTVTDALKQHPGYYSLHAEYIPLLDIMNRESEFFAAVEGFRKIFPSSDMYRCWLAEFYMTRDTTKFIETVKSAPQRHISDRAAEGYLMMLCGDKRFSEAADFCRKLERRPAFRHMLNAVLILSGDGKDLRKRLLQQVYENGEYSWLYHIGMLELAAGFDPVMYWNKGFSMGYEPAMMRGLCIMYENGVTGTNSYYTGDYTDLHPEFENSAKRRKVTAHIFSAEKIFIEGEDLIPPAKSLAGKKFSNSGIEHSSGEIISSLPDFDRMNVLSVFTAKEGVASVTGFSTSLSKDGRLTVSYKTSGEEFSAVRYYGECNPDSGDIISVMRQLRLKSKDEELSSIEYNVICYSEFIPHVMYNGVALKPERTGSTTLFSIAEKSIKGGYGEISSSITRFGSDGDFVQWYRGIIRYAESCGLSHDPVAGSDLPLDVAVMKVHSFVTSEIKKTGGIDFNPRNPDVLLADRSGTAEERTYLARAVLEKRGIKSFIAFRKNENSGADRILLYVPEGIKRGYWLDFYNDWKNPDKQGYSAVVITGDGYETVPVTWNTYIR